MASKWLAAFRGAAAFGTSARAEMPKTPKTNFGQFGNFGTRAEAIATPSETWVSASADEADTGHDCKGMLPRAENAGIAENAVDSNFGPFGISAWGCEGDRDCVASESVAANDEPALPREWTAGLVRLQTIPRPPMVRPSRWRQAVADADRFLREWGAQAAALEWTTLDLFGAHPLKPVERVDCAGLILLLHGDPWWPSPTTRRAPGRGAAARCWATTADRGQARCRFGS